MPVRNRLLKDEDVLQYLIDGYDITAISRIFGVCSKTIHGRIERQRLAHGANTTIHLVALLVASREYLPQEYEGVEISTEESSCKPLQEYGTSITS